MHLLAAEKIEQSAVHGHSFFCRDFEANVVDMNLFAYRDCGVKILLIPLSLAFLLAWIVDRLERLLIRLWPFLFGRNRKTPFEVLDFRAVELGYIDMIVSGEKGERVLDYQPLITKEQCMEEARTYCNSFYAGLRRTGGRGSTSGGVVFLRPQGKKV